VEAFFSFFADGELDESKVLPTVEEIIGRPPRTFEQWASAHSVELLSSSADAEVPGTEKGREYGSAAQTYLQERRDG
jgi:hypothetical protein